MADFLDERPLQAFAGLHRDDGLHAIRDAAHFHRRRRRALAGAEAVGLEHDIKPAFMFQNIALADVAGDNLDHLESPLRRTPRPAWPDSA